MAPNPGFEHTVQLMSALARRGEREREQHLAQIDFRDIGTKAAQIGEIAIPAVVTGTVSRVPNNELVVVNPAGTIQIVKLGDLSNREIPPNDLLGQDTPLEDLKLTGSGTFAARPVDASEVIVGMIGKPRGKAKRYEVGEPNSFGFLSDGRFVHLDIDGKVRIGDNDANLNEAHVRKRWLRKDLTFTTPVARLAVEGSAVLIEDRVIDEQHQASLEFERYAIVIGVPPSRDYYKQWYNMRHKVVDLDRDKAQTYLGYTHLTSGNHDWIVQTLSEDQITGLAENTKLHPNGLVSKVTPYRCSSTDMWGYYQMPVYDNLDFYSPSRRLGGLRVNVWDFVNSAVAITPDRSIGFAGKNDGTVEVVTLNGKPTAQRRGSTAQHHAKINTDGSAVFSAEYLGDAYPHRTPPRSITFWKAHDKALKQIFTTADAVHTVDVEGNLKSWDVSALAA